MGKRGRLLFSIFILLAIASIFGYFYITKSEIKKDFDIVQRFDIVIEPIFNTSYRYYYDGSLIEMRGEVLRAVFSYIYNNTPYVVMLIDNISAGRQDIVIYDIGSKSIIDAREVPNVGSPLRYSYHVARDRVIITIASWVPDDIVIQKITIDNLNISNIETIVLRQLNNTCFPPVDNAILVETNNGDRIYITCLNRTTYREEALLLDSDGNIIDKVTLYTERGARHYGIIETKDYVFFGSADGTTLMLYKYDKNAKTLEKLVSVPPEVGFPRYSFIVDYMNNVIMSSEWACLWIWRVDFGNNIKCFSASGTDLYGPFEAGTIRGDKIFRITSAVTTHNYELLKYSINGDNLSVERIRSGVLINLTKVFNISFDGNGGSYFFSGYRLMEIIGGNYFSEIPIILSFGISYLPEGGYSFKYDEWYTFVLADIDNYTASILVIANDTVFYFINESHRRINEIYLLSDRYVLSVCKYTSDEELGKSVLQERNCTVYLLKKVLQTVDKRETGFGIEITPTPTEINITYPNVTQNVTTTRPTGIQSVIEILRRNWWLILLAILLLILIAASLRRRTT